MNEEQINDIARKFADLIDTDNANPSANVPTIMARIGGAIREAIAEKDAEIERLKRDNKELEDLFDLRWKRDREAVERWRAAEPGRELEAPDRADLVVFLLERLAQLERTPNAH